LNAKYPMFLLAAFTLLTAHAQPIQPEVLFVFPNGISPPGPEGPNGKLVQGADGSFYGMTNGGGEKNRGTVFKVTPDGNLSTLFSFNGTNGGYPQGGLFIGGDGNFYGTTTVGGTNGLGTVFKLTVDGILTTLVSFDGPNGAGPVAGLALGTDGNFYGTTQGGGSGGGAVFKLSPGGALTTLASFASFDNVNGAAPQAALTLGKDGNFYGTTSEAGQYGFGTIFQITPDGTLTTLASFNGTNGASSRTALTEGTDGSFYGTATEGTTGFGTVFKVTTNGTLTRLAVFNGPIGQSPWAPLILASDGSFYGTAYGGGANGYGTVFRVTINGAVTRLVSFNRVNGEGPQGGLIVASDGNFYGTTLTGGGFGINGFGTGTLFKMTPNGILTKVVSFAKPVGVNPGGPLLQRSDGDFYGATFGGGAYGYGTIFKATTNGAVTTLASFDNSNGAYPDSLTLGIDGNMYGTTEDGGAERIGAVFKLTTNGALTRLASFNNANGAYPIAPLTLGTDGNFYGTASGGGARGFGTVFKVTPSGTLTRLVSFNKTNGAAPVGALTLGSDSSFYGTTSQGGSGGGGTVYRVTPNGVLTTLFSFENTKGQHPQGTLTLGNDGNFYGLAGPGVPNGPGYLNATGTLFRATVQGTITTLGSFNYDDGGNSRPSDLTLGLDGNFYGTTPGGSSVRPGTVFQVTPNGAFATLFSFASTNGAVPLAPLIVGQDGYLYGTTEAGGSEQWSGTIFRLKPLAPVIFSQPQPASRLVRAGAAATISASVFGASPFSAQWTFNDTILPGETNTWLALKNLLPSMSGNYSLRVINSLGNTSSSNAVLTVLPALITNLPVTGIDSRSAVLNGSVTLGPNETLAWFEWGEDTNYGQIDGVTSIPGGSDTMRVKSALSNLRDDMTYHYRIVAMNSFGIVYGPDQSFQVGPGYAYAQSVLADEPLIYYRFAETNGTVALNSGFLGAPGDGTYNDTVSVGNPSLAPLLGYAAGFNNTNSGVSVPALGAYSQITIEAWLKPRGFPRDNIFDSIYTTDNWVPGALHTHLVDRTFSHQFEFSINGNDPQWINAGYPALFLSNSWVHLAATYDSAARETITYANGRPFATNLFATAVPVNLTEAHIGEFTGSPSNWFDGEIDEFALYGKVLPASRLQAHYRAVIGNPVLVSTQATDTLVFSWTGPGFRLEENPNLSNVAAWTPVIGGSNSPVSVRINSSANQFFRLKLP
jgi:uncharacterized repeat protein (TIGR03803 family)